MCMHQTVLCWCKEVYVYEKATNRWFINFNGPNYTPDADCFAIVVVVLKIFTEDLLNSKTLSVLRALRPLVPQLSQVI